MNERIGKYITKKLSTENYKAYVPPMLPPNPPIDLNSLYPFLEKATLALAELNSIAGMIPNISLFVYMYVRKEALLSSQIEGTQSSFADLILFEHQQKPNVSLDDVEEVANYVQAINYGLKRLNDNFPMSLRLICEIHAILLSGTRGANKLPGEFRRSQNWIGGSRPGNALFVPPPVEILMECLSNLESFIHDHTMPTLIKAGIAHVQFETIHPFLDGNGRLGRLLITLLLCTEGILQQPILYLSLYFKQNRQVYYDLLQQVRIHGTWETWLEFFLEGITKSAKQAVYTVKNINTLFETDLAKIQALGRIRFSCIEIFEYIKRMPQISVTLVSKELNMTAPTARSAIIHMQKQGILEELTGKKRDRIYVYRQYLNSLEDGAEPILF